MTEAFENKSRHDKKIRNAVIKDLKQDSDSIIRKT